MFAKGKEETRFDVDVLGIQPPMCNSLICGSYHDLYHELFDGLKRTTTGLILRRLLMVDSGGNLDLEDINRGGLQHPHSLANFGAAPVSCS